MKYTFIDQHRTEFRLAVDFETSGGALSREFTAQRIPSDQRLFDYGFSAISSFMAREGITDLYDGVEAYYRGLYHHLNNRAMNVGATYEEFIQERIAIKALHGLGLNVYAGEDLPHSESDGISSSQPSPVSRSAVAALANHNAKHKAKHDNGFSKAELLTANQLRYLKRLIMETHSDEGLLLEYFGFEALADIPKFEVNRVIRMLESNRDKEAA